MKKRLYGKRRTENEGEERKSDKKLARKRDMRWDTRAEKKTKRAKKMQVITTKDTW